MTGEEEIIATAQRVQTFLADEAVVAAFDRLQAQYFREFTSGKTPEDWGAAWARNRALSDLKTELNVVVDNGKKVAADNTRRTARRLV